MLKAVIFDFDGVISDSEPIHYKAINAIISRFGIQIPREKYWAEYLGFNDADCFAAVSDDYNLNLTSQAVDELVGEKFDVFAKLAAQESSIIDGVGGFIEMLKTGGIRLAICSGALSADIELMLKGSVFADSFEVIVTADTEGLGRGKPYPDGYLLTVDKLNETGAEAIGHGDCVVIDDSHWGLEAAAAAGMARIAVANTYPAEELSEFADKVVSRLGDLTIAELEQLCTG
jgi:beta-phosphoglucomutase